MPREGDEILAIAGGQIVLGRTRGYLESSGDRCWGDRADGTTPDGVRVVLELDQTSVEGLFLRADARGRFWEVRGDVLMRVWE